MPSPARQKEIEELKKEYFRLVENFTPQNIKDKPFFDMSNPDEMEFMLTKEIIEEYKLEQWLVDYEKIAKVSTGGIRGPQNVLYHWDTRFPLNQMGVILATLGKALVLKERIKDREIHKIVSSEVRYNSKSYVELITRLQTELGIHIHLPFNRDITAIWLASFLIFMFDFDGGEYVTSSHAVSSKIATKDLDNQGSQFAPEMSIAFINKIKEIIKEAKGNPDGYKIKVSKKDSPLATEDFNGFDMYTEYLKKGVATDVNLGLIKTAEKQGLKIIFDTVGGCMYKNLPPILEKLGIEKTFEWRNKEVDPFFHGIGKTWVENPNTKQKEFFDYSCDTCLIEVVKTMSYEHDLLNKEIGQLILITDPDGDRLVIGQIESSTQVKQLEHLGINYIKIDDDKILSVYHPTFSFLMTMDFHVKQLKAAGVWDNHPRVLITTTPSSWAWDEWAKAKGIKIVTVPVGFKEIATVMKKIEKQLLASPDKEIILTDVYGKEVNLGVNPRIVFAGEESGGMMTGPEELIVSKGGRKALAMREKSAAEASVITSALAADLFLKKKQLTDYLLEIFEENNIKSRYYFREDYVYYNESEPDPIKLRKDILAGEIKRDKTDKFYLSLSFALKHKATDIEQVKIILSEAFPSLDFNDLENVIFDGDSSQFIFNNMFVQIRRSGTDAKLRGYSCGSDKKRADLYLHNFIAYDGTLTKTFKKVISDKLFDSIYELVEKYYTEYLFKDS